MAEGGIKLMKDEFVELLLHHDRFIEQLNKLTKYDNDKLEAWCEDQGYNFRGWMYVLELMDDTLKQFLSLGFAIYETISLKKVLEEDPVAGLNMIKKIKQCLVEAYRLNIMKWSDGQYKTLYKDRRIDIKNSLIPPPQFDKTGKVRGGGSPVKYVLTDGIVYVNNRQTGKMGFSAGMISVLDDFVDIDARFLW
jgi:hypothetical protein